MGPESRLLGRCATVLRLRRERKRRNWSLTKVTVLTGIDTAALSKIERGLWPCGPAWRRRLAEAFGLPEEVLFEEVAEDERE